MSNTKMVYVTTELHKRLKVLAAEKGVTVGKLVEISIEKLDSEK